MKINMPVTNNEIELRDDQYIVSKTDLKGVITYVNKDFLDISGFSEAELIGASHNIVRHPDMPPVAFQDLWDTLKAGRPWRGLVKNRAKNGDFYWVEATAMPLKEGEQTVGYISLRRKATRAEIEAADAVYRSVKEGKAKGIMVEHGQVVGNGALARLGRRIRDTNVGKKLGLLLAALVVTLVVQGGIGLWVMSRDNAALEHARESRMLPVLKLDRIIYLLGENSRQVMLALQHNPANPMSKVHDHPLTAHTDAIPKNADEITALWQDYKPFIDSDEHRRMAETYNTARMRYVDEGLKPARAALLAGKYDEANRILIDKVNPLFAEAYKLSNELVKHQTDTARKEHERQVADSAVLRNLTIVLILLIGAAVAVVSTMLLRSITRPLETAIGVFKRIAQGLYDNRIDVTRDDEIGKMMQALQATQARAGFDMSEARRVADESLRIKIGLDNVATNVMIADRDNNIIYMNQAVARMFQDAQDDIRKDLPGFDAARLIGTNIDSFHKNPAHQREMLARLKGTHRAAIKLGGRSFALAVTPVVNERGERLGTAVEWQDRTAEVAIENEVADLVSSAASGDFTKRLVTEGKQGFFRELAGGLNQLVEVVQAGLNDIARVLNAIARGQLTERIEADYSGTFGQLKDDSNTTVERLRETVLRIKESTEAINTASQEIAVGNQDLSSRTEEQASSLEETASSMEELNATVKQNAENARQANDLAKNSNEIAEKGGAMVKRVVATMDEIQGSSKKIAEIVGVIDSIAFQTNILALNAAVEAARAGEQGRGFAVVASEVRNLAQRSATAAKEIKNLIAESVEKVDGGARLVQEAGSTMDDVVTSFQLVANLVTEITNASREQSSGIEQVTQAVSQMDEVTQQNAALVEEAAAAAESLEEQARALVQAVSMFRLSAADVQAAPEPPIRAELAPVTRIPAAKDKPAARKASAPLPKVRKVAGAGGAEPEDEWEEF